MVYYLGMKRLISQFSYFRSPRGYTLIELLLFGAIFTVASIIFISVFVAIVNLQVRASNIAEVDSQSQFVLQSLQRYIERAVVIDIPSDVATSTLKLWMPNETNATRFYMSNASASPLLVENGTSSFALTSPKVKVGNLSFVRRVNPGGKDSVAVSFTVENYYPGSGVGLFKFTQAPSTIIARASAATFDSDIRATSTNTFKIGAVAQEWLSINDTIFFGANSNVGINVTPASSGVKLQVAGGNLYMSDVSSGVIFKVPGNPGPPDVCYLLTITGGGILATSSVVCP